MVKQTGVDARLTPSNTSRHRCHSARAARAVDVTAAGVSCLSRPRVTHLPRNGDGMDRCQLVTAVGGFDTPFFSLRRQKMTLLIVNVPEDTSARAAFNAGSLAEKTNPGVV
ncbi:hypothetical protein BaRGS_00026915 [Batillaria attramentaria]|uniref:Uncharacterized protein n=1 Tax=Batillaria attramentaria TaxID=370345 RepID=A0ABD0K496_9CAEN